MGLLSVGPSVLGACSLTAAVELICALHMCVCVAIISVVSSEKPAVIAGVELSPVFQCVSAAWCLLGIPVIIHGGVGAIYTMESHLSLYYHYLMGTTGWAVVYIVIFTKFGNRCSTMHVEGDDANTQASFACGISNGMVIFWMLVLIVALCAGTYIVGMLRDYTRKRLELELIRYQEPWQMVRSLADDAAEEEAKALSAHMNPDSAGFHGGQQGAQRAMGNWAGQQASNFGGPQGGGYYGTQQSGYGGQQGFAGCYPPQGPPAGCAFATAPGPSMAFPQAVPSPQAAV